MGWINLFIAPRLQIDGLGPGCSEAIISAAAKMKVRQNNPKVLNYDGAVLRGLLDLLSSDMEESLQLKSIKQIKKQEKNKHRLM